MNNIDQNNEILKSIYNNNPINQIKEKEFNDNLLKFGSLVTILKNKRINQTMLLLLILEDSNYNNCFKQITEIDDDFTLISSLIIRFPILHKSKIIKTRLNKLNKNGQRKRKKSI